MQTALYNLASSLPFLGFITAALLAWHFYLKARTKERMALIEKGVDLSKFYKEQPKRTFPWLSIGIVLIGICTGILFVVGLVFMFPESELLRDTAGPGIVVMGVFFGALSMLIVHRLNKRQKDQGNG